MNITLDLHRVQDQSILVSLEWTPLVQRQVLQFPLWTPGSYTVRDPAQHLSGLELKSVGGVNHPLQRLAPHRWLADLPDCSPLRLTYRLDARDLTVRTAYLDSDFASLSPAAVVMEVEGFRWDQHHLSVAAPDHWQVHCPLPVSGGGWLAADFDALIDSPVHAGPFAAQSFDVQGHQHELLLIGDPPGGWPPSFLNDVERVCVATCQLMGTPPPAGDRYQLVIQMLDSGYGGLEHDHSSVLQFSWGALAKPEGYRQLLQLVGHEYLHQWNVRRLRPIEYRPYDYGRSVVSEGLWFAEGITSYFDLAIPLLAQCSDRSTLLRDLGDELSRVLMTPGRKVQSLAASAQEAWIKLYKSSVVSPDSQVSYYRLGAATAFCLDVRLRDAGSSLAALLRGLWQSHGTSGRGFDRADVTGWLQSIEPQLAQDLEHWLDTPDALPLHDCLALIGARLDPVPLRHPHHGLTLADSEGRLVVRRSAFDSPARDAGLVPGDELIAVDGRRLHDAGDLKMLLRGGKAATITYARRRRLAETQLTAAEGVERWSLGWEPGATTKQRALREAWFRFL